MALYTDQISLDCHRVRFVLAEKGINVDIIDVSENVDASADLAELNPYNETPTLVDRDMVLYGASVINDYLDERYPHPPLMPVDPVSRARLRLVHYRIRRDWFHLAREIENGTPKKADAARKQLKEEITAADELFSFNKFLLSDELSLVDCSMAPLLWRLEQYKISLPKKATEVDAYCQKLFARQSFRRSLTDSEREMRDLVD